MICLTFTDHVIHCHYYVYWLHVLHTRNSFNTAFIQTLLQGAGESATGEVTRKVSAWCTMARHCLYHVLLQDVHQMIDLSLAKYSADRIGKFDFALENSGGSVIIDKCSKTYSPSVATVSVFGYPLWHVSSTPKVIIQVSETAYYMYLYTVNVVCIV